ncbi:MAG TPA: hypothetical protein DGT21_25485 [Armatimonadetes bacterium]|nr:hypothetical protein [Armatimonadota bacterium]
MQIRPRQQTALPRGRGIVAGLPGVAEPGVAAETARLPPVPDASAYRGGLHELACDRPPSYEVQTREIRRQLPPD